MGWQVIAFLVTLAFTLKLASAEEAQQVPRIFPDTVGAQIIGGVSAREI